MTLKQLAKMLNQPIGNLIRKAHQVGLKVGQNSTLTEAQIQLLKTTDTTPQLKPAADNGIEIKQDEAPAAQQQQPSITSIKQQQLSQSIQAESEQFNYQVHSRLQQSFNDGQELGVLEVLAREQGRTSAAMAVSQAIYQADLNRRAQMMANLSEKLESEDFLQSPQTPAESYWESSQVTASTSLELNQILTNLANI